ncbi:galactose oxidase [Nitzschia inconspicua]|uniref:Galactose oxidase n=1 Tax=Nitzschia inconspicua TaxID=303405 RepID=A0A9K3PGY9_9STRA|nr:galactose oxidase [Nitzschia inconspicua]
MHDPERFGAAGPAAPTAVAAGGTSTPRRLHHHDQQAYVWSRVHVNPSYSGVPGEAAQSLVPPPRSGAASVVVQDKLYVFGGYGGGTGRLDDFYAFDFRTCSWEEVQVLSEEKPGCRENNGVVVLSARDQSIILFGGYNGHRWLNDLWKFDIATQRWTCLEESTPDMVNEEDETNAAGMGMPQQVVNASTTSQRPSCRFGYVSVVYDNKLVLWGGFDGQRWLNDMYVYDFGSSLWSQVQQFGTLPSIRSCPASAAEGKYLYIQGGYDGLERKEDFFVCSLDTYTWTQMPNLGRTPSPRYFHSCVMHSNKLFMYGGYSGSQRLGDMFAYDFETNHWSEVDCSSGDSPGGRSSLIAQVHENNLYIFAGYNGQTVLNDMYKCRLRPIGIPSPSLLNDFRRLINDPETADVCFLVEGREVHAHKAILAARSQYFRAMLFNGHMRESSNNSLVEIRDVSHPVFCKVLEYLYTDTVCDATLEVGIHLMVASELFMLDRLKSICEDLIRGEISTENVISILVASHQHNALGLKEIALDFILQHLSDAKIQCGLTELKSEPDLLIEILKLSSLQPVTPFTRRLGNATQHQVPSPGTEQQPSQAQQVRLFNAHPAPQEQQPLWRVDWR